MEMARYNAKKKHNQNSSQTYNPGQNILDDDTIKKDFDQKKNLPPIPH